MLTRRRGVLAAGAATMLMAAAPLAWGASASRRLVLFRGDSRIGEQTLSVTRSGDRVDVAVDIEIDVNIIALPVYSYRLSSRETWNGGALDSLEAECNDNGTEHFARATRSAGELRVEGSEFTGTVPGNAATTTYWTPAFLDRPVWISTQDGRPLDIRATNGGSVDVPTVGGETISATRWRIDGDLDNFELYYDAAGEWVGSQFQARGETARFLLADRGGALAPLWTGS
jgi:hypothetical protein